jgi:hypothetical protein
VKRRRPGLVVQMLESIPGLAFKRFPDVVRELAHGRNGVYALYSGDRLYYVGKESGTVTLFDDGVKARQGELTADSLQPTASVVRRSLASVTPVGQCVHRWLVSER